jgi:orsellinic acid C2-O-methyltransferase
VRDLPASTDVSHGPSGDVAQLMAMINGAWVTQVIRAACVLGLPDHLSQQTADTSALAAASGCKVSALRRLLLAMAALELCEPAASDGWRLTNRGRLLCRGAPQSLHHWARHAGGGLWQRLGELPEAVRTGASWPERHHGVGGYEQLAADEQASAVFHQSMVELTRHAAPALVALFELDSVRCVVDVGGGRGELLGAVLQRAPAARGVLHDQAAALEGAAEWLERFGVAARCRIEAGDFFVSVPAGADLYLLKSVLHNWDDEACRRILARCFDVMPCPARLLVIERLRPDVPGYGPRDREVARTDLNMLVSLSGQERSRSEYAALFADAGLCLASVRETGAEWSVLEARRDPARG